MTQTWYYFRFEDGYIALDSASGGEPYKTTDPNAVKFWRSPEEAMEYASSYKTNIPIMVRYSGNWGLRGVEI